MNTSTKTGQKRHVVQQKQSTNANAREKTSEKHCDQTTFLNLSVAKLVTNHHARRVVSYDVIMTSSKFKSEITSEP